MAVVATMQCARSQRQSFSITMYFHHRKTLAVAAC